MTDIALPRGADPEATSQWNDFGHDERLCWSPPASLPDHLVRYDVRAVVAQRSDGTILGAPTVHVGQMEWSAADARLIAVALLAAADIGDEMAGGEHR